MEDLIGADPYADCKEAIARFEFRESRLQGRLIEDSPTLQEAIRMKWSPQRFRDHLVMESEEGRRYGREHNLPFDRDSEAIHAGLQTESFLRYLAGRMGAV